MFWSKKKQNQKLFADVASEQQSMKGLITRLLGRQLFNIYGFAGLMVGYVIYTIPVAFLLIYNTMGYVDKKNACGVKGDGGQDIFDLLGCSYSSAAGHISRRICSGIFPELY